MKFAAAAIIAANIANTEATFVRFAPAQATSFTKGFVAELIGDDNVVGME